MSDTFLIHTPHPQDLPALIALWRERMVIISQSVPHLRRHIPAESAHVAQLEAWLTLPTAHIVCATQNNTVIGYIVGDRRDDIWVIQEMALDAHAYHRGLGKGLFVALQTWFTNTAPLPIVIRAPRYYAVEQAFWRALGATDWTKTTWEKNPLTTWMLLPSVPPPKTM
jgi:hypothetical protein